MMLYHFCLLGLLNDDKEILRKRTAECSVCQPEEKHEVPRKCFHILSQQNCWCVSEHLNHALSVSSSGPSRAVTGTNGIKLKDTESTTE